MPYQSFKNLSSVKIFRFHDANHIFRESFSINLLHNLKPGIMKLYRSLYKDFEQMYLGYATVAIILSSCLGSAAAMVVLMNGHDFVQMFQLFLIVVVCMGYNSTVLANLKPKHIFNALVLSIVVSSVLLLLNVFMRY